MATFCTFSLVRIAVPCEHIPACWGNAQTNSLWTASSWEFLLYSKSVGCFSVFFRNNTITLLNHQMFQRSELWISDSGTLFYLNLIWPSPMTTLLYLCFYLSFYLKVETVFIYTLSILIYDYLWISVFIYLYLYFHLWLPMATAFIYTFIYTSSMTTCFYLCFIWSFYLKVKTTCFYLYFIYTYLWLPFYLTYFIWVCIIYE